MDEAKAAGAETIFAGNSQMARLMRSRDWSQTSLGSPAQWSQSLKTAVRIMLTSRQPMFVWWGEELINLYNDAYIAIVGGKHPNALGQPASVVWQEIWDQVGPRAESAMFNNEGTYDEALLLIMERNGYPEETYYTFSYSPVPDDQGNPCGIICANTDDTQRIIGERQFALLRELAAKTADARTFNAACTLSAKCLETNRYDLPFAMIYLVDADQQRVVLAGTSGIDHNHPVAPETVNLDVNSAWPFAEVIQTQKAVLISDLVARFGSLPMGAWDRVADQAVVTPIAPSGQTGRSGILVAGLNPFRLFDDNYRSFINLVTGQISASIANANSYEEERQRAEDLAELDRAKTLFFSNVSHEFRTPLTLMLSPLEDLSTTLDARLQPDEREQLQLVQRNGLRLQKLVNTLLDFSRIEAGRVQASYEPTDLATYTAELASTFRSLIEQAGMSLVIDCPALPELVYVDREMWEKIVLNLISNAFKFTFSGSITVKLRMANDEVRMANDNTSHFAQLTIIDTGVGIPDAELPRLFERFHRVSGTRSRTYEGSGIGLALVQELVKLHGGTIRVTSRVDYGTTFAIAIPFGSTHLPSERIAATCTLASTALGADPYVVEASRWIAESDFGLPIADFGLEDNRTESSPSLVNQSAQSKIQNLSCAGSAPKVRPKILLADDNADMRDYVKRLLSQYWDVETVSDGLAALEAIAQRPPDLVLSDVMMPRMDGFGLLRELRNDPRTREIPLILLSARAGEESRIEGLAAGADDYLIKPFSARELLARVEATLKLAQLRKAVAQREQALRVEVQAAKDSLDNVLTRIADQFLVLDREWRYTYVNDRVTEITGIARENLLGRSLWEVFPDTVDSQFYTEVHRAVVEQTPVQVEYFYPTWNRWFENRVYPSADGVSIIATEITERKRTEEILRRSEERYRTLFDSIDEGFCIIEVLFDDNDRAIDYRFLEINSVFERQTGLEQAVGKTARQLVPDLEKQWVETYGRVALTGEPIRFENQSTAMNRWFDVYACRTGQPEERNVAIVFSDISDRKRAEEFSRSAAELDAFRVSLADALRPLADPVEIQATASRVLGEYLGANRVAYFEVCGADYVVERDYVNGVEALAGGYPIDSFGPKLLAAYRTGRAVSASDVAADPNLSPDQRSAYAAIQIGAYIGIPLIKGGAFVAGLAVHTSGSRTWTPDEVFLAEEVAERTWAAAERARAEAALQQRETELRLVTNAVPALIAFVDADQRYRFNNEGYQEWFGCSVTDIYGKHLREVLGEAAYEAIRPYIEQVLTGQPVTFESQVPYKEGGTRYISATYVPRFNSQRGVEGFVGLVNDISDRKRFELEREQLLAREQAAREQAESANRIKDEFLAVLSHELRSPLNPILGWSQLLQQGRLDATKTKAALDIIERNAQLQAQLINDLLDISRILRGKLSLEQSPVDVSLVIASALETVRLAAEAKSLDLRFTILDFGFSSNPKSKIVNPKLQVLGDAGRLQQVVWNLLSNAVKFTPNGGRVEVRLSLVTGPSSFVDEKSGANDQGQMTNDKFVQITVTDTGKGIAPDFLPYVFDHFRQEDGATTRKFGGLGLGLAIARQIVEMHGGWISVDSPGEGQGATFTVRLPLLQRTEDGGRRTEDLPRSTQHSALSTALAGLQILVVDDDADSRDFIAFVLEKAGAIVRSVTSGIEALQAIEQSVPDLIVSDIAMPEMDGYMVMRKVRDRSPASQVPAIALTAYAGEFDRQQALQAGFQRHLAKPVEPIELVTVVSRLCGQKGGTAE
ncbi:MAG: response regulator [Leptolyngbyaceae cyanobacterium RU_5_1]|nr:response regulator [Leptolyngbyaceae cyanobacterium RU_5_1]